MHLCLNPEPYGDADLPLYSQTVWVNIGSGQRARVTYISYFGPRIEGLR